jgi:hypothetical protein
MSRSICKCTEINSRSLSWSLKFQRLVYYFLVALNKNIPQQVQKHLIPMAALNIQNHWVYLRFSLIISTIISFSPWLFIGMQNFDRKNYSCLEQEYTMLHLELSKTPNVNVGALRSKILITKFILINININITY